MKSVTPSLREARIRELLLWCAPALVAGALLRLFMEIRMPYGFIQFDTADFLLTPFRLLSDHHYIIDSKKAFLTPTFFSVPFFLHIPALLFIPVTQHLMGLIQVLIAGALMRLWFPLWRWIIVPATLLIATSPWQLWYEQTLMGEANYVFFLYLVALLGTLWAIRRTWGSFAWFALAIFCICGTRAEGKIMLLFGIALIPIVLWPRWRPLVAAFICLIAVYEVASLGAGGSHAFSLLYATLFQLTPDDIHSEPGVAPYLMPLRDRTIPQAKDYAIDLVQLAKDINDRVETYLHEKRGAGKRVKEQIAIIERHLCIEVFERHPLAVITMPLVKFQLACDGWASGSDFGVHALREKQPEAINRLHDDINVIGQGMIGAGGKIDQAGLLQFSATHYDPERMKWFNQYERAWSAVSVAVRLPDRPAPEPRWAHDFISPIHGSSSIIPGIPVYFLLAFAGILAAIFIPTELRLVQAAWLLAMLLTWYAATMVGVTNPRFRFAYEPVCYTYAVAAVVWAIAGICRLASRSRAPKSEAPLCTAS